MFEKLNLESVDDKQYGWYSTLDMPEQEGVKCKIW